MADVIDYQILGDDLQLVEIELDYGEGVRAEVGTMTYMENGIQMQTDTGGGLFSGFKRMVTGESFFITTFMNNAQEKQCVAFAAPYPGKIVAFDLDQFNGQVLCQKDSFLCAARGTEIEVAFTKKLGAGFFGGEGFILQRLTGDGMVFVHAGGTVIEKNLAPGEILRVDTGCLVAFGTTVDYDIQFVGGFKNAHLWRGRVVPCQNDRTWQGLPAEPALFPPGGPYQARDHLLAIRRRAERRSRRRRRYSQEYHQRELIARYCHRRARPFFVISTSALLLVISTSAPLLVISTSAARRNLSSHQSKISPCGRNDKTSRIDKADSEEKSSITPEQDFSLRSKGQNRRIDKADSEEKSSITPRQDFSLRSK